MSIAVNEESSCYRLKEVVFEGCDSRLRSIRMEQEQMLERTYSGSSLMYAGFTLPQMRGNYPSAQLLFELV